MSDDNNIDSVVDYTELKRRWQYTHMRIMYVLTGFILLLEVCMVFYFDSHQMLETSISVYVKKYVIIPTVFNLTAACVGDLVIRMKRLSDKVKEYTLSVLFTFICFVVAAVHGFFTPVFGVFIVAILITMVYEDWKLTSVIMILSGVSYIVSYIMKYDNARDYIDSIYLDVFVGELILFGVWLLSVMIIRFEIRKRELVVAYSNRQDQLEDKLIRDELTGVYNKLAYGNYASRVAGNLSMRRPGYLIMLDVDNFKQINDTLGHLHGDKVLKIIGEVLNQRIRQEDIAFRFGGDEFCILCHTSDREEILQMAKRIQEDVKNATRKDSVVTISMGLAKYDPSISKEELMERADQALYQAKKNKDKIVLYE